jgi:hypothetical protein
MEGGHTGLLGVQVAPGRRTRYSSRAMINEADGRTEATSRGLRVIGTLEVLHTAAEEGRPDEAVEFSGPYSLRTILGWFAVLIALFVVLQDPGGRPAFFEVGAVFHYYLGAKYFNEIGPFDLYACAIAADGETSQVWDAETPVRDLHIYTVVRADSLWCPRERFTSQRWAAFLRDVSWITATATPAKRASIVTDKGYNATPFFSVVFGQVAHVATVLRLDSARRRFIVFNLDVIFLAIAIWIVWSSAGATIALLTLVLALGFFGNFGRVGGNFGQYVWFSWLALAVAAWRARRPALGGAALGIAAGFQVFPVFFAIPVLLSGLRSVVRRDREGWMRPLVFSLSLVVAIGSCVAVGSASGRGAGAWRTWQQKMAVHSAYLRGEVFDIGLPNLIADALSRDRASGDSYEEDIPHSLARQAALGAHRRVWFVSAALLMVLMLAAVWSVPEEAVLALGFVPLYALLALSPYYYFALVLLPFMAVGIARRQYRILVGMLAVLFAANLEIWGGSYVSFSFGWHAVSQVLIAGFVVLAALVPLAGRHTAIADDSIAR